MADSSFNSALFQYPNMFSLDQLSNKYSPFAGQALPWPASYEGWPTDAMGNPINGGPPTTPGTTLNSSPVAAASSGFQLTGDPLKDRWTPSSGISPEQWQQQYAQAEQDFNATPMGRRAMMNSMMNQGDGTMGSLPKAEQANGQAYNDAFNDYLWNKNQMAAAKPAAAQSGSSSGSSIAPDYLSLLSNPGKVNTPGATVPQAAPPSGQSSVLQQFLQNWQPQTGAGGYSNAGFLNALKGS